MAALSACDTFLLLSNGKSAGVVQFSAPDKIQLLDIPDHATKDRTHTSSSKQQESNKQQQSQQKTQANSKQDVTKKDKSSKDSSQPDNHILASAISPDGRLIALCDDRKVLHIYTVEAGRCSLSFSRHVSRRCTAVTFTRDNLHVVVSDRSGDVYLYDVLQEQGSKTTNGESESREPSCLLEEEEDGGSGALLLGHMSMLLQVLLIDDDKLIVSCDRDEKIRISNFPDCFNIRSFCLGHTKFVSSLAYDSSRKIIISGSGDSTIRLWNVDGVELGQRNVGQDILAADIKAELVKKAAENSQPVADSHEHMEVSHTLDTGRCGAHEHMEVSHTLDTEKCGAHEHMEASHTLDTGRCGPDEQNAVQQTSYCSACQVLFVVMHKSPHILLYKLLDASTSGQVTLCPVSVLSGRGGHVASLCVRQCVLWVLRQGQSGLEMSAYQVRHQMGSVEAVLVNEVTSTEFKVMRTLSDQDELLQAPPDCLDLVPLLWKSTFQEGAQYHNNNNNKRHKTDADAGCKEKKRRQKSS